MAALTGNELLYVLGSTSGVLSGETFITTTGDIAALGGGGGGGSGITPVIITSGSTSSAGTSDAFIGWRSSTPLAKTQTIVPGSVATQIIYIKDAIGTAATYNITITGSGCTIDDAASFVMSINYQSVGLKWDGISNWMIF